MSAPAKLRWRSAAKHAYPGVPAGRSRQAGEGIPTDGIGRPDFERGGKAAPPQNNSMSSAGGLTTVRRLLATAISSLAIDWLALLSRRLTKARPVAGWNMTRRA